MGHERRGVDQTTTSVRFVAYQSEAARIAVGQQYRPGCPEAAFFVQPSGKILQGLDAFSSLLPHLSGGTLVQLGLGFGAVRQLAEGGYRLMARYRYRWFGTVQLVR